MKLIETIYSNGDNKDLIINTYIVNTNPLNQYKKIIKKYIKEINKNNIIYIDTPINQGKHITFKALNYNFDDDEILVFVDDKDMFIKGWKNLIIPALSELSDDSILVTNDYKNDKYEILGDVFLKNATIGQFYYKYNKGGEKLFWIPSKIWNNINLEVNDNNNYFVYDEYFHLFIHDIATKTILQPIIVHKFIPGGVTHNFILGLKKNYNNTKIISLNILSFNYISFRTKINVLFNLYLIRRKTKFKLNLKNWILYKIFEFSLVFYFHEIKSKKKFNKIIERGYANE